MKLLKIDIYPIANGSKLKARANITLADEFGLEIAIKGYRIHDDGVKTPWVGVPTERYIKNNIAEFKETVWMNQKAQSEFYPRIIDEYKRTAR